MSKLILCLFFGIAIGRINPVNAQVTGDAGKWTIETCFRYATEHNIQVSTLRLAERSSQQDLIAAKGARLPGLSGTVTNNFNNANNVASNGRLVNQLTSSGNYSVGSSITLWNDHYISNNIRQRELLSQVAGLSIQQSLNSITLLITQSYLDILLAKENLKYITDLVNTSEARVKQGRMFYDAGSIAKKDLLQLQAQQAGDKYLLVQTQHAISQNILTLKQLLQLPADTLFEISAPDTLVLGGILPPLYDVKQSALQNFPEIRMGRLNMDVAALDIAKAKSGFKPVLTASGSLGTGYSSVITNAVNPKTGYFKQAENNFYQRAGVTLAIPIFSNRINRTNLEKAHIAYKQAGLNLQNDRLLLSQEVERAYLNASNAREAYDAASLQLEFAAESYRISNEQFKLGAANTYDLLQQRNQYVQAVEAFIQAKYTAVLQQKIYEFYMGKPVTF